MNPDNDFEEWIHPTRSLSMPPRPRHVHWRWMRRGILLLALAITCGLFAAFWQIGHIVGQAWHAVFSR